jgi:indole-3-glycerol phosphate synthase
MNTLQKIIQHKKQEVQEKKELYPIKLLEKSIFFKPTTVSLKKYLLRDDKSGIIAEFKRKSPSKGNINAYANVEHVSISYMQAGASALSVLTDSTFFGGNNKDLETARKFNFCPILRKEFIIDEYQIFESRSIGADAILLIAEILTKEEVQRFSQIAKDLGLEVLFEIHSADQLEKLNHSIDIVGVNNRNLETFKTNVQNSFSLVEEIPSEFLKISESGINNPVVIHDLKSVGYDGFLIGESFMQSSNPGKACENFVEELKCLKSPNCIEFKVEAHAN